MSSQEEEKTDQTNQNHLIIQKILRLIPKHNTLYIDIETSEKQSIIKDSEKQIRAPLFSIQTDFSLYAIKENEIYTFTTQSNIFHNLEKIIYNFPCEQIILIDRGFLFKKENPLNPKIFYLINKVEKNDIKIYHLEKESNLLFKCEEENCYAFGQLDIEKQIFNLENEHSNIEHNNLSKYKFLEFFSKFKDIKIVEILIVPTEYDLKKISDDYQKIFIPKNNEIESDSDYFSLSGSEDLYLEKYVKSQKRRKITHSSFLTIYKGKYITNDIKQKKNNEEDSESNDSVTDCSQCTTCFEKREKKLAKKLLMEKKNIIIQKKTKIQEKTKEDVYSELIEEFAPQPTSNGYVKKNLKFFKSKANANLAYCEVEIVSNKEHRNYEEKKDTWYQYFDYKYGKNHRLGMHFCKTKNGIYVYKNRHLELKKINKYLYYYCNSKNCGGVGKFDCIADVFIVERSHNCNSEIKTAGIQGDIMCFFKKYENYTDVQVVRIVKD